MPHRISQEDATERLKSRPESDAIARGREFAKRWHKAEDTLTELRGTRPDVVEALFDEGLTYAEAAVVLETSVDTLYRAMRAHRASLKHRAAG